MKAQIRKALKGTVIGLMGVAMLALLGGCGDMDRSPMATDSGTAVQESQPALSSTLVFSPRALGFALAKKVKGRSARSDTKIREESDDGWFDLDDDAKLRVEFDNYGDENTLRVGAAKFTVREESMDVIGVSDSDLRTRRKSREQVHISMTVSSGQTLSDVSVVFTPHGLLFNPAAKLEVVLEGNFKNLADGDTVPSVIYHISGDGKVTKVLADVELHSRYVKIRIDVPSFSTWDWNDVPEADGGE